MEEKRVVLMILDGWGHGNKTKSDAIYNAETPFIDSLYQNYPHAELLTFGEHVGLPTGQMGNSEVGHLNIGAGRIVYQDLVKINNAIKDQSIRKNKTLLTAFEKAKKEGVALHFMGLVSDGGVHSSQEHLHELCSIANDYGITESYVHAFTDGRDTDPKSGLTYLKKLEEHLKPLNTQLASVIGRYYAMDRDKRWERVKKAYDLLVSGTGMSTTDLLDAVQASYNNEVTDEFIEPIVKVDENAKAIGRIKEGDVVVCFNFRTDRCREITEVLTQKANPEYDMQPLNLHYVTMTNYDKTFKNVQIVFEKDNLQMTLGETLALAGKKQIRIAETEKYPHVTFFFSGGRETEFEGEKRLLINSPKVATYDLQPEMSAPEVTQTICRKLEGKTTDFVCLNFANPDMVGHTGVYEAIVRAVETIDNCVEKVVTTGLKNNYAFIIIADHGNADFAINEDGSPNTAHSVNPVPIIIVDNYTSNVNNGVLGDVAPTILQLMGLKQPAEMSGTSLV